MWLLRAAASIARRGYRCRSILWSARHLEPHAAISPQPTAVHSGLGHRASGSGPCSIGSPRWPSCAYTAAAASVPTIARHGATTAGFSRTADEQSLWTRRPLCAEPVRPRRARHGAGSHWRLRPGGIESSQWLGLLSQPHHIPHWLGPVLGGAARAGGKGIPWQLRDQCCSVLGLRASISRAAGGRECRANDCHCAAGGGE